MYVWDEFAGKSSANYTKCFATAQNQTSSCWLAEVYEDILRLSFFLSLIERKPIHVKSALKEKKEKSSLAELLNLSSEEEYGYDFE